MMLWRNPQNFNKLQNRSDKFLGPGAATKTYNFLSPHGIVAVGATSFMGASFRPHSPVIPVRERPRRSATDADDGEFEEVDCAAQQFLLHVGPAVGALGKGLFAEGARKWRNRIITRCSSNVNVAISVSKTLLQLDLVTSIQRVVQCCHLASPNLKNSHVSSNNFHVSICFHSREKN